MRKTIILSSILVLVGFASVAQASDWSKQSDRDPTRVHREVSDDSRADRHDVRKDESRARHDGSSERRRESRETHDDSDTARARR